jgi:hypothetical protein
MCPACLASAGMLIAATVATAGGATALVAGIRKAIKKGDRHVTTDRQQG